MQSKKTLFNDPIYGFIPIDSDLILQLINHPFFQRLRRISQMGLSNLVYPGAHHTRFEHAIGAMHVMRMAVNVLKQKGIEISHEEIEAMKIAVLLHDIGHGPFSHASENILIKGISHEVISLKVIKKLNEEFNGKLDLAIKIFTNNYNRKFMYQLVSGQIDVDRLDYLKRDSFYTGVTEGNINADRIIAMMNVENENLVFEEKAVHSLEKFLLARRLMYWQVYLHKTSLAAELVLVKILHRFFNLIANKKEDIPVSHVLYHLIGLSSEKELPDSVLNSYLLLDDSDIIHLLKSWTHHKDFVLSTLSKQIIYRDLPKVQIQNEAFKKIDLEKKIGQLKDTDIKKSYHDYFIFSGNISNQTYVSDHSQILLINKSTRTIPLTESINYLDFNQFSKPVYRYYLCYPKQ